MRVRISDPSLAPDLAEFFRRNEFLAVQADDDTVDVLPISTVSERSDRLRIHRYAEAWLADHPGVLADFAED
jgi:hypothetical protein